MLQVCRQRRCHEQVDPVFVNFQDARGLRASDIRDVNQWDQSTWCQKYGKGLMDVSWR